MEFFFVEHSPSDPVSDSLLSDSSGISLSSSEISSYGELRIGVALTN